MVFRFFIFVLVICILVYFGYLLVRWLLKPEVRKTEASIEHNVKMRDIIVDKEIDNMKKREDKLKKELSSTNVDKKKR